MRNVAPFFSPVMSKRRPLLRIARRAHALVSAATPSPEPIPPQTPEYFQSLVSEAMRAYQAYNQALECIRVKAGKTPDKGAPPLHWSNWAAHEIDRSLAHAQDVAHHTYGLFYSGLYALAHMAATFEAGEVEHA